MSRSELKTEQAAKYYRDDVGLEERLENVQQTMRYVMEDGEANRMAIRRCS